jgi:hypothetical protein
LFSSVLVPEERRKIICAEDRKDHEEEAAGAWSLHYFAKGNGKKNADPGAKKASSCVVLPRRTEPKAIRNYP